MALTAFTPRPGAQSSAFDLNGLANLRRDVQQGAGQDAKAEIARQFEALYLQMMLKRMREATPRTGLLDSDQTRMVQSMADEQTAVQLANPGIGLAQALLRQMNGNGSSGDPARDGAANEVKSATVGPAAGSDGAFAAGAGKKTGATAGGAAGQIGSEPGGIADVSTLLAMLAGQAAATATVASPLVASAGAPAHVSDFVDRLGDAAAAAARESGVPARLILSQAALESGWGKREIKFADGSTSHNMFGIKAGANWSGKVVHVLTTEYVDGEAQKMLQPFRAYDSYEESFKDYARLVGKSPRYESVTRAQDDVEAARLIQQAGYATDPRYADKLISIMDLMRGQV